MKIDCDLYPFVPKLMLFHSKKKCKRWCIDELGCIPDLIDGADAQTMYHDGTAVVLFTVREEETWENALLVHESYHVVCDHLEALGETDAGEEIMAYMIQCVSGALMDAHKRWREKHVGVEERQQ